jgi:hypothetical protein
MAGGGDDPGPRLRHNMKASGSLVFLSGGYYYEPNTQVWTPIAIASRLQLQGICMRTGAGWRRGTALEAAVRGLWVVAWRAHLQPAICSAAVAVRH